MCKIETINVCRRKPTQTVKTAMMAKCKTGAEKMIFSFKRDTPAEKSLTKAPTKPRQNKTMKLWKIEYTKCILIEADSPRMTRT